MLFSHELVRLLGTNDISLLRYGNIYFRALCTHPDYKPMKTSRTVAALHSGRYCWEKGPAGLLGYWLHHRQISFIFLKSTDISRLS